MEFIIGQRRRKQVKINFGKFKGMELADIVKEDKGISYLKWLVETGKNPPEDNKKSSITKEMVFEAEKILSSYTGSSKQSYSQQTQSVQNQIGPKITLKDLIDAIDLEIGLASHNLDCAKAENASLEDLGVWQGVIDGLKYARKVTEETWNRNS